MAEEKQTINASGEDVETAIAEGLKRLGVARQAVDIEIIDEGSRGLFGIGSRDAQVRLTLKETEPAPTPAVSEADQEERSSAKEATPAPPKKPQAASLDEDHDHNEEPEDEQPDSIPQIGKETLQELLGLMDIPNAQIQVRKAVPAAGETHSPWIFEISGPDTDDLIGRRGETLAALQRITRLIVGREISGPARLVLDVGGYKKRRAQSLRQLATRLANQAIETQRTVVLEPMPPNERRVVHLALRDSPDVRTQSVGEGDRRKVTIIPTKR